MSSPSCSVGGGPPRRSGAARWRHSSRATGMSETTTMTAMIGQQVVVDAGDPGAQRVPGQRDAHRPDQAAGDLPDRERAGGMPMAPASGFITVRTTGMNRARTMARGAPYRSMARWALPVPRRSRDRAGRASRAWPARRPMQEPDLRAGQRARGGRDQDRRQAQVRGRAGAGGAEQAGGEQQRVAGQEEPDQQPGLGEQDQEHAQGARAGQQAVRVEQVERRTAERSATCRLLRAVRGGPAVREWTTVSRRTTKIIVEAL